MLRRLVTGLMVAGSLTLTGVALPQNASASTTVFQDFETNADLNGISVSLPEVDSAVRVPYGTHGESGLRFTVGPADTPGATASSGVTLHTGTPSLPVTDWSGHVAVGFDFFTNLPYDTVGRVTVRDTKGKAWGADYTIHARGWTPFNARLSSLTAAGVDVRSISYIGISIPRADAPVTGFYDAFRLADEYPYDQSSYSNRAASALLEVCGFSRILTDLAGRLDGLERQVGRSNAIDLRLRALVNNQQADVAGLRDTLRAGRMDGDAYAAFNAAVTAAQRAVPRLTNTIDARAAAPQSDFGLASADSMALVYPKDLAFTSTGSAPVVRLAKGEYESAQAVVLPYAEELHGVQAQVSSVRGPDGKPASDSDLQATIAPVGSLDTTPSSAYRRPVYKGWTPDPIRDDLTTVDVAATDVQPYWIRVHASDAAPTGTYSITLRFSADGRAARTMTVTAKVWAFAIPDQPKLLTSFQYTPRITNEAYGVTDPAQQEQLRNEYWSFLNDYKIKPDQIYTVDGNPAIPGDFRIRPTPVEDVVYIRDHYGLRHFNALYLNSGLLDRNKPETWQAQIDTWLDQLDTAMASYRAAGVDQNAYVYGFDEATGPMLQAAKQTFAAIKARFPDLPIMTTLRDNSMGVDTGLAGLVDIWVPQQDLYNQAVAERTRARGDQAWWYPDIATGHPLPNWFNGFPPIDARMLMGPMSYQAGVEGVLYYATNRWLPDQHAAQPLVDDGIFSRFNPVTFGTTAGDGSLFYPGPHGPMASIRIENFRDGMEDYNLLWTLRQELTEHPDAPDGLRQRAEELLTARDVVTSARKFTEDPEKYRDWRLQVAGVITQLEA
ncbi:protein of unknown function [Actinopolymorpha cephalotaxi]|uniref:Glycoside hydrolase 123 catalytic domain-containing protein n=1 Tax=Actinopolymorpha cephalotaxi TaxID=504797 RepID=A0A1I2X083_9ACTN|nr:DUF4091 domain-containing protein [Actinopolymorpha cephalotaxi]NYH85199.1 hypothetical protein [Actinopolymorpha cephalotaxi]SFH06289.1 protein of unknown function [Actinopolymorpha cephalotaxi]